MKRLLILAMIALVPALSGCCGVNWPRLPWSRGANCATCPTDYDATSAPIYGGSMLPAPPLPSELPGLAAPPAP